MIHIIKYGDDNEIVRAETSGMDLVNFSTSITTKVNVKNFSTIFISILRDEQPDFIASIDSLNELPIAWGTWGKSEDADKWCEAQFRAAAEQWDLIYESKNA
jgi:hypothetical protein